MPISLIDPPTARPVTEPAMATTEFSGRRKSWTTTSQKEPSVATMPSTTGVRAAMTASCSSADTAHPRGRRLTVAEHPAHRTNASAHPATYSSGIVTHPPRIPRNASVAVLRI